MNQKIKTNKKIAFIAQEYSENNFTSGGIKLNFEIIKFLAKKEFLIDIYAAKINHLQNICENYYSFDKLKETNLNQKYDYILSEKAIWPSDVTYIHDHSFKYRITHMKIGLNQFFYKIFNFKKYKTRKNCDKNIKENLKKISTIIVSSEILKKDYMDNFNIPSEKIIVIPPPVIGINEIPIREQEKDDFIFGVSAIGFVRKGGYIILKALKILKKTNKNFKVKIIYPKIEKNFYLKFLIKFYGLTEIIEFLPLQTDMNKFYASINCLVLASLIEPYGMVATEALFARTPIIISNRCGAAEIIMDNKNGFIFDFKKNPAKELAKSMEKILNLSNENYKDISENAHSSVKHLSIDNFLEKYIEIMNKTKK